MTKYIIIERESIHLFTFTFSIDWFSLFADNHVHKVYSYIVTITAGLCASLDFPTSLHIRSLLVRIEAQKNSFCQTIRL